MRAIVLILDILTLFEQPQPDRVQRLVIEAELSITLLLPVAARQTVQRKNIKSLRTEPRSLMPEGLEAAMKPQDLRNLVEFLQAGE